MRISDWSSDVCSSDLVLKIGVRIPSETQEKAPFRGAFLCLKGRQQKRGPGFEQARCGQCVWSSATQQIPSETQEKAPFRGAFLCLKGRQQKRGPGFEQARCGQCVWGSATQQIPSETQEKAPFRGAFFVSEGKTTE